MLKVGKFAFAAALIVVLAACVAGSTESQHAASNGALSQFLLGLWHGVAAPFTLIGEIVNLLAPSLLPWRIGFFEVASHSVPYDVGFYLGVAVGPPVVFSRWSRRA